MFENLVSEWARFDRDFQNRAKNALKFACDVCDGFYRAARCLIQNLFKFMHSGRANFEQNTKILDKFSFKFILSVCKIFYLELQILAKNTSKLSHRLCVRICSRVQNLVKFICENFKNYCLFFDRKCRILGEKLFKFTDGICVGFGCGAQILACKAFKLMSGVCGSQKSEKNYFKILRNVCAYVYFKIQNRFKFRSYRAAQISALKFTCDSRVFSTVRAQNLSKNRSALRLKFARDFA